MLSVLFSWEPSLAFLGISIGAHWLSSQWTAQAGRLAQWLTSCAPSRPGRTWMCICGQQGCKICRGSHQCLLLYIVVRCCAMVRIYIYIYWLHVSTRRFDACFRAIPGSSVYRHVLRASTSARRTGLLRCRTMCTNGRPVVARDTATFRIPLLISMSLVQNTNQNSSAKKEPRLVAWWWFIFWTAPWSTIIN